MSFQFGSFKGIEGDVKVPALGAVAGIIGMWTLRREDDGPNAGQYRLHAALSYSNELLLRDPDFNKEASLLLRRIRATGMEERIIVTGGEWKYYDGQIDVLGANVHVKK